MVLTLMGPKCANYKAAMTIGRQDHWPTRPSASFVLGVELGSGWKKKMGGNAGRKNKDGSDDEEI